MLQKLNERIQGIITWVVIVLVALALTMFGVDYFSQSNQSSAVAAEVDGEAISKQWIELSYHRLRQGRDLSELNTLSEQELKQKILDDLILKQVSLDSARHFGFTVSSVQADAAILNIPEFQKDGKFSSDRYQQVLNSSFFTPQSFEGEVADGMLLNQQRFAFMGTSFVLPQEIKQYVKYYGQTRTYRYLLIPIQSYLKAEKISDADVQAYYEAHQDEFIRPERVKIDFVRLSMGPIRQKVNPSEEDVLKYYEESQTTKPFDEVREQMREQLIAETAQTNYAQALEQLTDLSYQTPDSLSSVIEVMGLSLEHTSAFSRSGGVESITQNPLVIQAAFSHDVLELENNSAPIPIDNDAVVVLRVVKRLPAQVKPLAEVKDEIQKQLTKNAAVIKVRALGESLLASKELLNNKWHTVKDASHDTEEPVPGLNELVFSLVKIGERKGRAIDTGYLVVELENMHNGNLKSLDEEQIASISQQIEANEGVADYDLYINQLLSQAKIKKYA